MRNLLIVGLISMLVFAGCAMKSVNMQSAEIYNSQGEYNKAIEYYLAEIAENPQNDKAYFDLGQCYRMKYDYVKMSEAFDNSLKISDRFYSEIYDEREELWVKFYNEGVPFFNDQKYEKALDYFEKAVIVDPTNIEGYKERGMCYLQLSNEAEDPEQKAELIENAIADYKHFISMDTEAEDLAVRINLANIYFQNNRFDEAVPAYKAMLDLEPDNITAISQLALIYQEQGDSEKAIEMYEKVLKTKSDKPNLWFNLGVLYFQMDEFDKAKASFDKVLEINPDDVETLMNLVSSLWKAEMYKEAIPYLERVVELEPDNISAWYHLFTVYANIGETEKAKEAFKKYKELGGTIQEKVVSQENKQRVEIINISGTGNKKSAPFELSGAPAIMKYKITGESSTLYICIVNEGQDIMETGGFPELSVDGAETGESWLYKKRGRYYLSIISANGNWNVVIEEKRQ
ncbi:MAG: tetratricopeptide repeat protein [candidate division Zixibacteria bacterium]|nr:tetratricopeptide repeat protein [Candidatus Tariuqbacter arcticus]